MENGKNADRHKIVLVIKKNIECFLCKKKSGKYAFSSIKKWTKFVSNDEIWEYLKEWKIEDLAIICEEENLFEMPYKNLKPSRNAISVFLKDQCNETTDSFQTITHTTKKKMVLIATHSKVSIAYWKNTCSEYNIKLRFFEFEAIVLSRLIFDKFPSGAGLLRIEENQARVYSFSKGQMNRKGYTIFQDERDFNRLEDLFSSHRMIHQKNYPLLFDMTPQDDKLFEKISEFWSGPIYSLSHFCESKDTANYYKTLLEGIHGLPEYAYLSFFSGLLILRLAIVLILLLGLLFLALDKKDVKLGYFEPEEYQSQKSQSKESTIVSDEIENSLSELNAVIRELKTKSKAMMNRTTGADNAQSIEDLDLNSLRYVGIFKNTDNKTCGLFTYKNQDMTFCEQQNVGGINFSFLGKENALVVFQKSQYRIDKTSVTLYE
ncbi:MAG: hypothetical protein KC646_16325 [Candidatus Cloacimonetes bacterium]|nr:hypothetical protein [Candidatus Cloacimonadota bacterium]